MHPEEIIESWQYVVYLIFTAFLPWLLNFPLDIIDFLAYNNLALPAA
jgi:hypothetical protein